MSADEAGGGWKLVLRCSRAEAEAAEWDEALGEDGSAVTLVAREADARTPDEWLLEAYLAEEPGEALIDRFLALAPGSSSRDLRTERLPARDWVTLSQSGMPPVTAGRFHVHTGATAASLKPNQIGIRIEAGQAFGTGQHATTAGCLEALDRLGRTRRFENALDLGTGSAILAIAIAKRWRRCRVMASDIDPVSIRVAAGNLAANGVRAGRGPGQVELVTAAGFGHPRLRERRPYDLVVANILAEPLIALAAEITESMKPGGTLVLAGLLDHQAHRVAAAYQSRGLRPVGRIPKEGWPTLILARPLILSRR